MPVWSEDPQVVLAVGEASSQALAQRLSNGEFGQPLKESSYEALVEQVEAHQVLVAVERGAVRVGPPNYARLVAAGASFYAIPNPKTVG